MTLNEEQFKATHVCPGFGNWSAELKICARYCDRHEECFEVWDARRTMYFWIHTNRVVCRTVDQLKVNKLVRKYDRLLEKALAKIPGARLAVGIDDVSNNFRDDEEEDQEEYDDSDS